MMRQARLHRLAMAGPDDVSLLTGGIARGAIDPAAVVAIIGKTEGNGCVNDFTRAFAVRALHDALPGVQPSIVMSGGTEGALSPHMLVLEAVAGSGTGPALAVGTARTPDLRPEDLGGMVQVRMVADGVLAAMAAAGISSADDVHFVQIKCPLLTAARIAGRDVATRDTLKSMGLSRGASALGVALALGEVTEADLVGVRIGQDLALWSGRASTSAGIELTDHEIVVLGMSADWCGDLVIDHAVMMDQIDVVAVRDCLDRLGFSGGVQVPEGEHGRLVALLAKAEAGSSGQLRGLRHTMLDDSDISSTRHARGFVGGVLAGLVGHAEIYVSGGAEHQGPDGGGPVAVIARKKGN